MSSLVATILLLIGLTTTITSAQQGVYVASGELTPPQITDLYDTPVELIATPGAGYRIQVIYAILGRFAGGDGDIVGGGGGDGFNTVAFQYGNTPLGAGIHATVPAIHPSGSVWTTFHDDVLFTPSEQYIGALVGATPNPGYASANEAIFVSATSGINAESATANVTWSIVYAIIPV